MHQIVLQQTNSITTFVKESTDSKSPLRSKKSTDLALPAQCLIFAVPVITALKQILDARQIQH